MAQPSTTPAHVPSAGSGAPLPPAFSGVASWPAGSVLRNALPSFARRVWHSHWAWHSPMQRIYTLCILEPNKPVAVPCSLGARALFFLAAIPSAPPAHRRVSHSHSAWHSPMRRIYTLCILEPNKPVAVPCSLGARDTFFFVVCGVGCVCVCVVREKTQENSSPRNNCVNPIPSPTYANPTREDTAGSYA